MLGEPLLIAALLAFGAVLGWALSRHHLTTQAERTHPSALPTHWPIKSRPLVNRNEAIIWRWVRANFPNHRVLVKLPFSRFTAPIDGQSARGNYDLLNGLYATFTVADRDGTVVGCIDLMSNKQGMSSSQQLKQGILADLDISYEVIQATALPTAEAIQIAILGHTLEPAAHSPASTALPDHDPRLENARSQLMRMLDRQRDRRAEFRPSDLAELTDDDLPTSWQAPPMS